MVEGVLLHGHVWRSMELVFIDDVTADRSSRMNSKVYRVLLSAHIQPHAGELMGQCLKSADG